MSRAALIRPRRTVSARPPRSLPIFASIVATVFALVHLAIGWRLVGAAGLEGWPRGLVIGALVALYTSVPLAMGSRYWSWIPEGVARLGFNWIGVMFYWFAGSVLAEPIYRVGGWLAPELPWGPGLAVGVAAVGAGLSLAASRGAGRPALVRVEVPVAGLDPALDGFRIAQISDVHVGPTVGRAFVEDVVAQVNGSAPDMVAITGDLVDGGVESLAGSVAPLAGLRSRHGSYFVTGNHEYYAGAAAWCAHLGTLGVRVLRNERVALDHQGAKLDVAGIDDAFAMAPGHGPDLGRALAGRDPARPVVLLAHQPVVAGQAAESGVALVLSGHTHGGQLWPFVHLVKLVQPFVAGLEKLGDTWVYVSRGTAWWGPPMRLGAPNEITLLTLRRA